VNLFILGQMQQIGCVLYLLKLSSNFGSSKQGLEYRMVGQCVSKFSADVKWGLR
jgi:hypothetical protein